MEIYLSSIDEFLNRGAIVNVIIDNLNLIHDNPDTRNYVEYKIAEFLGTLKRDLTIIIETEYVDKSFRNSYYTFYATKLRNYHRNCVRISFFSPDVNEYMTFDSDLSEKLRNSYLGFLILRPLAEGCIGRNVISPSAKIDRLTHSSICEARIPSTCLGVKLMAAGFPHSSQDGEMTTCAETTVWSILEYFGNKYSDYHPVLPSDILTALKPFAYKRQLPSEGLTFEQISIALQSQGFGCKVYSKEASNFKELFTCYIESGIPLAVCIETNDFGHAVVCVGNVTPNRNIIEHKPEVDLFGGKFFVWNNCIDNFIFNDDNYPCYKNTTFNSPTAYYNSPDWDSGEITHFIVPLHPKVYIDADLAISASNYIAIRKLKIPEHSVLRTFLASNRSYREYIVANVDFTDQQKQFYLQLDMPKFIWITEISNKESFYKNKVNGLIILDATGSNIDNEGYSALLFMQKDGIGTFYNQDIGWFEDVTKLNFQSEFESFRNNLKTY